MKRIHKSLLIFFSVVLGLIIIDMLLKVLTDGIKSTSIIPNLISFVSVHNDGIAYGLMSGAGIWLILSSGLLTLVSIAAWYWFIIRKGDIRKHIFLNVSFALFVAGAIGNLYDRIAYGFVRDFIKFDFWPSFAIFNFADICITVGTIMLGVWFTFFYVKKEQANAT